LLRNAVNGPLFVAAAQRLAAAARRGSLLSQHSNIVKRSLIDFALPSARYVYNDTAVFGRDYSLR